MTELGWPIGLIVIGVLSVLGCGIVCGFFLTFSAPAMQGLHALGPSAATRAMQSINVAVVRPPMMLAIFGTAVLCLGLIIYAAISPAGTAGVLIIVGSVIYLLGNPVLTIVYNVPRNNALAAVDPDASDVADHWNRYHREWTAGNHVRTLTAGLALVLVTLGLVLR